jgi:transglutaminase-like putative cysteine protease
MELVKAPAVMLQEIRATPDSYAVGDCDDVATLGAAIALAMGLPVRFVLLGFELGGPFSHVYADAWSGGRWVELDTTKPAQFPPGLQTHRRATFDL